MPGLKQINRNSILFTASLLLGAFLLPACYSDSNSSQQAALFQVLDSSETGLQFANNLTPTGDFNMFNYMYFYNGAGVGVADFNKDGRPDIYFAGNQESDRLYLNKGDLKFEDRTGDAGITDDGGWSTGVSVVDINHDGLMDIYVCRVGHYETLHAKNRLLICTGINNGIPQFQDQAAEYGLDFSGFSTQAAFFDYDLDGDLDMYLLNHAVHQNGSFAERKNFEGKVDSLSGDRLYRNDAGHFTDVSFAAGIYQTGIGYGLGICVSDINRDGYPDLYIGNDFHENDYLYINQKDGSFKEQLQDWVMHTSQFSMGVDIADINNDSYSDIISMDMLPDDPYILKRSLGEDTYEIFNIKIRSGYFYQFTRNNLQLNMQNNHFAEIGLYAGIAATDWSWAPLFLDFDNDGRKDLFISNGIPKRLNDIDYVNFVSSDILQDKIRDNAVSQKELEMINKFPEIKLPNQFFFNRGDASFSDMQQRVSKATPTYSNGAAYADFDGDGDLDIVVSNIDAAALLYENRSAGPKVNAGYSIAVKGDSLNPDAIGSKVFAYTKGQMQYFELEPVRGFQSSMQAPLLIGTGMDLLDSVRIVFPDNTTKLLKTPSKSGLIRVEYEKSLPAFNYQNWPAAQSLIDKTSIATDITDSVGLQFQHVENRFNEFSREPLIPHMFSTEGPALAVADVNGDGRDDIFFGSAKTTVPELWLQTVKGQFSRLAQPELELDSMYEEADAKWVDVNGDQFPDLVLAPGGNEYYGDDQHLQPRLFLNDGKGNLHKAENAFPKIFLTSSRVAVADFNADGAPDLFFGGRVVSWKYGQVPRSYLLLNDGKGNFKDLTGSWSEELLAPGFVTDAVAADINKDGKPDLVISREWGGISAFINEGNAFKMQSLTDRKGWWNCIEPLDVDGDGDIDFVAGNLGLNSRLKASSEEPLHLYVSDFDHNGTDDQVLTYYLHGREIPFANKMELERQIPLLKKRFLYAGDFAKTKLSDIFGAEALKSAKTYEADYLANAVLINRGDSGFVLEELPWLSQLFPLRCAAIAAMNRPSEPLIFAAGNYYDNNIEMGRADAGYGLLLSMLNRQPISAAELNGLVIRGQIRRALPIRIGSREAIVLAMNNDSARVITIRPRS